MLIRRRGGRLTVYLHGLAYLLYREGRRSEAVVEVINGLPFGARLVRRRGLLAVVHHLHQSQWSLIYPGLKGRVGWWVESAVTPALYRHVPMVTVSEPSRHDLLALGIEDVTVVHNGTGSFPVASETSPTPLLCVLARLVPHKQIEHAFETLADLRADHPDLRLDVIGDGWWADELPAYAEQVVVADLVTWHGHVPDA
ncbi:glycosyltransferase, partial [Nocardioides hankookensis]